MSLMVTTKKEKTSSSCTKDKIIKAYDYKKINKSQQKMAREEERKKGTTDVRKQHNSNSKSLLIHNHFTCKWVKFSNQMNLESMSILLTFCPTLPLKPVCLLAQALP